MEAVFICNQRVRLTNPKLMKGSMGAVFTMPIFEFDDIKSCREWLQAHEFGVFLANPQAVKSYKEFGYEGNTALVVGNERYGLSKEWNERNTEMLSIPMRGICDSLNVGAAASIMIYEICMKKSSLAREG